MGIYYFRFTIVAGGLFEIEMWKNEERVMLSENPASGPFHAFCGGLTLLLMVGDRVNMHVPKALDIIRDNDQYQVLSVASCFFLSSGVDPAKLLILWSDDSYVSST